MLLATTTTTTANNNWQKLPSQPEHHVWAIPVQHANSPIVRIGGAAAAAPPGVVCSSSSSSSLRSSKPPPPPPLRFGGRQLSLAHGNDQRKNCARRWHGQNHYHGHSGTARWNH
ncbi:hypothetical protein ACA910_003942 [Epithemia clementina (nom. ined.)]